MKFLSILIYLILFPLSLYPESKIFIKNLDFNRATTQRQDAEKIQNLLVLNVIRVYKNSAILSDDALIELLKHDSLSQSLTGDSSLIDYLSSQLNFDELITGKLDIEKKIVLLSLKSIQLKNNSFHIKSQIQLQFPISQSEYYLWQSVKNLQNPNYQLIRQEKINSSHLKLTDLSNMEGMTIKPFDFSNQTDLSSFFSEGMKHYLNKADKLYNSQEYKKANEIYLKIMQTIHTLSKETQGKRRDDIDRLKTRIFSANNKYYELLIGKEDKNLNELLQQSPEKLPEKRKKYIQLYQNYNSLPEYALTEKINQHLKNRIYVLGYHQIVSIEKKGDEKYQNLDFTLAIDHYKESISICQKLSDYVDFEKYKNHLEKKIKTTEQSAYSYTTAKVSAFLFLAESANSRSILEAKMKNRKARLEYKNKAIILLDKARNILDNNHFRTRALLQKYNNQVNLINEDSDSDTSYSLKNIMLLPVRYTANIVKGVTDIFVLKFGLGLGIGGEAFFFGATPAIAGSFFYEVSSSYGIQRLHSNNPNISPISNSNLSLNLLGNKPASSNNIIGFYYFGVLNCSNVFGIRLCTRNRTSKDEKITKFDFKKYTTANLTIGVIPMLQFGVETHRIPELVGTIFFQDWNLLQLKQKRRYQYFSLEKADTIEVDE